MQYTMDQSGITMKPRETWGDIMQNPVEDLIDAITLYREKTYLEPTVIMMHPRVHKVLYNYLLLAEQLRIHEPLHEIQGIPIDVGVMSNGNVAIGHDSHRLRLYIETGVKVDDDF